MTTNKPNDGPTGAMIEAGLAAYCAAEGDDIARLTAAFRAMGAPHTPPVPGEAVERVAKAIFAVRGCGRPPFGIHADKAWEELPDDVKELWRIYARAAIAALSSNNVVEPSEGCDHYKLVSGGDGPWTCVRCGAVDPPRPKYEPPTHEAVEPGEAVERVARIIDPSTWETMDGYLEATKRKYRSQNVMWPADQFKDKASMAKAREIIAALSSNNVVEPSGALASIADYLVNQQDEPEWGRPNDRLHYWRDKAITAAERIRAAAPDPVVERLKPDAGSWWYPQGETDSEHCSLDPGEVIDDCYSPRAVTQVIPLSRAASLPDVYAAVRVWSDAEKDQRDDDEDYSFTLHNSEAEARAALASVNPIEDKS
jgi:hypothetical protein